jgi:hypothetical protein
VGLTRETVNTVLLELQRRSLAESDQRAIRVLDVHELRALR